MINKVEDPITAHEESDVSTTGIIKFAIALTVSTFVICLLVWGLFAIFDKQAAKTESLPPPLYREERLPPEPRLQGMPGHRNFPSEDIGEFRAREEAELGSYGWINQQNAIVHIPIEEAKKLIVARGLPATHPIETGSTRPKKKP